MAFITTLTDAGQNAFAEILAGTGNIVFDKVEIGSGASLTPKAATALVDPELDAHIESIDVYSTSDGNYALLTVVIQNDIQNHQVNTAFAWTEMGIYAQDPTDSSQDILYAYVTITEGDGGRIPAASAASIRRKVLIYIYVEDAPTSGISATLDTDLIYVTDDELIYHNTEDPDAHAWLFARKQTRTDLLNAGESLADTDVFPIYKSSNTSHLKVTVAKLKDTIRSAFGLSATGILKGTGTSITSATAGVDYQKATQQLSSSGVAITNTDSIPYYRQADATNYKTTVAGLIDASRVAMFANKNGIIKSDSSGNLSVAAAGSDYQKATSSLTAFTTLASDDYIPFRDTSDSSDKKFSLSTLVSYIKSAIVGGSVASGNSNAVSGDTVYSAINSKDIWYAGTSAPSNTKLLWIDTTATTGGLKYYSGGTWKRVPLAYSDADS